MNKRKFVAGVSIMTVAMAMGSPAMEAFAAETAVQFSGDEWDGHPEITQVNKQKARATFFPFESLEAAKNYEKRRQQILQAVKWNMEIQFC